jgi:iron complex transport system permease protein
MPMSLASFSEQWPAAGFAFRSLSLGALVAASMLAALALGRYPLTPADIAQFLLASFGLVDLARPRYDLLYNVIVEIRLPRVLAASLIGAALASSGAAYQAVFRNPLVSPDILGVLGGAAFGAAAGLLLGGDWAVVEALAFGMGLAAACIGVLIAHLFGGATIIMLVLGGMISGAFFAALLSLVKYLADPYNQLPAIVYWLMGSLGNADLSQLAWVAPPIGLGLLALTSLGRGLDALAMGDDEARALGVPVALLRYGVIAAATLVSALTVSIAGMIGWVGLFAPHFARLIVGPANSKLMPASAAFGAVFLLAADALSRSLGKVELPIGIITQLLGIPAFLLVLSRARRNWA